AMEYYDTSSILLPLLLGPVLYLTYSWFSTRKLSSFKKTLPGLLLLPLILGLSLGGMLLARDKIRSFRPGAEDLSYIRILDDDSGRHELFNGYSYEIDFLQEMRKDDPHLLASVSRYLSENLDRTSYAYPNGSTQELIAFKTKAGAEYIRKIRISNEEDTALWAYYDSNELYRQFEKNLPDEKAPGFQLGIESIDSLWVRTSENMEALKRIYACMRQELSSDTIERDTFDTGQNHYIASIPFALSQGGRNVWGAGTISKSLPKTTAQYFQEIKALQNRAAKTEQIKEFLEQSPDYTMDIYFTVVEDSANWESQSKAFSREAEALYNKLNSPYPKDSILFHADVIKLLDEIGRMEEPDPGKFLILCGFSATRWDENGFWDGSISESFWVSADTIPAFVQGGRAEALFQINCREVAMAFSYYRIDHNGENPRKSSDLDEYFTGGFDSLQNVPEGAVYTIEDGVFTASYTDANGEVHTYQYPPKEEGETP
ncbi:MAG: hypothetical protein J6H18_03960, partial [Lachnospiraceae bacterium]|nr:hypothetical protein [Lachnospiraceae bacterium]